MDEKGFSLIEVLIALLILLLLSLPLIHGVSLSVRSGSASYRMYKADLQLTQLINQAKYAVLSGNLDDVTLFNRLSDEYLYAIRIIDNNGEQGFQTADNLECPASSVNTLSMPTTIGLLSNADVLKVKYSELADRSRLHIDSLTVVTVVLDMDIPPEALLTISASTGPVTVLVFYSGDEDVDIKFVKGLAGSTVFRFKTPVPDDLNPDRKILTAYIFDRERKLLRYGLCAL